LLNPGRKDSRINIVTAGSALAPKYASHQPLQKIIFFRDMMKQPKREKNSTYMADLRVLGCLSIPLSTPLEAVL
jgi:hypothetical protein